MSEHIIKSNLFSIDWEVIDASSWVDVPDEDSPELETEEFARLQPLAKLLPDLNFGKHEFAGCPKILGDNELDLISDPDNTQ